MNYGMLKQFLETTRTGPTVQVDGFYSKKAAAEASVVSGRRRSEQDETVKYPTYATIYFGKLKKAARTGRLFYWQNLLTYLDADIAASSSSLRFSTSILIKSSLLDFFPRTISS